MRSRVDISDLPVQNFSRHTTIKHHTRKRSTMSKSTAAKKRKVNVLEEDGSTAGQSTSGPQGEGEKSSQVS